MTMAVSIPGPRSARLAAAIKAFVVIVALAAATGMARPARPARHDKAPEFKSQNPKDWIGPPQTLKALRGKVVLLDVWTFG
jgi:hypothetical protein